MAEQPTSYDYAGKYRRYLEVPSFTWTEWDSVGLVKQAVRSLEQGQFDAAMLVIDAMTRDDRLRSALEKRTQAIPSLPRTVKDAKGPNATKCAELVREKWDEFFPPSAVAELQKWGVMGGLGVAQNLWELDDEGRLVPRIKVWHPRFVYWRWDTRSFWVNTSTGPTELKHGDGQWILYAPFGLERAYMMGLVRSLYVPWLVRQWDWRDWARFSEVHGLPIRKAFVPANAADDDKERFLRECADIGSETVLRLPRSPEGEEAGFDLELLEAAAEGHQLFKELMEECNSCIAITLLGQNLTTEVKEGALASTGVHSQVEATVLRRDAFELTKALKTGSLEPMAQFNFGDRKAAPDITWETEPPEDKVQLATAQKTAGEAITALNDAGLPVDGDKMAETFGIPLREGETFEAQPTKAEQDEAAAAAEKDALDKTLKAKPKLKAVSRRSDTEDAIEGQLYVEDLIGASSSAGVAVLEHDFDGIMADVAAAKDFIDLKNRLAQRYHKMKPEKLQRVLQAALMLAELNGRHSVIEETGGA